MKLGFRQRTGPRRPVRIDGRLIALNPFLASESGCAAIADAGRKRRRRFGLRIAVLRPHRSIVRALSALTLLSSAALLTALPAQADPAPYDLRGPTLTISVTRAGKALPIAETPHLAEGDRLSIKADLPPSQSVHYLLVAGFLRGATNPPPDKWFFQSRTWDSKEKAGLSLTVPEGAQQLLVFLAPQTGGDFKTLVGAVRDRPGAFVRASQDLNEASLDGSRLDAFLDAVRKINASDPDALKTVSPLLARSLAIKLDPACLQKAADRQAACLTQGRDSLVLSDSHSTSMVQALTSGSSAQLVQDLSATPQAGGGYFSPYVGSVLDIARILDSFRTAQYQYIPALNTLAQERMSLLLNAPPSFQNPKSVLVVALPAIEPPQPPPLHAIDPDPTVCLQKPGLVLPVEGAPLVFSTGYAHHLTLRLKATDGHTVDAPLQADAAKGGLVVDAAGLDPAAFGDTVEGTVQGQWGFDPYMGPAFRLHNARPQAWALAPEDQQTLISGREAVVHLQAKASGCVQSVTLKAGAGPPQPVAWKASGPDSLAITVPLKNQAPGPMTLLVHQYGAKAPDAVAAEVYAAPSKLESFTIHAGDTSGVLKGVNLDQVAALDLDVAAFHPDPSGPTGDSLVLTTTDAGKLKAGQATRARIELKDGRTIVLQTVVAPPRPVVALIGKAVQPTTAAERLRMTLSQADELPHGGLLTFSVRAEDATAFAGTETIELAAGRSDLSARLTAANGGFTVQNAQVAVATADLAKLFGSSTFGPLRFRLSDANGSSDWQPLGVMVRLPRLQALDCPSAAGEPCQLSGADLFLISAVSDTADFASPVTVPVGFPGNTLQVPRPTNGRLYVKLSDDPAAVNVLTAPPPEEADASAPSSGPAP